MSDTGPDRATMPLSEPPATDLYEAPTVRTIGTIVELTAGDAGTGADFSGRMSGIPG